MILSHNLFEIENKGKELPNAREVRSVTMVGIQKFWDGGDNPR